MRTDGLRQLLTGSQRRGVALVAGDLDDVARLNEPRQRSRDRIVEAPDALRAAEDQDQPGVVRDAETHAGRCAQAARAGVFSREASDRRSGLIARDPPSKPA